MKLAEIKKHLPFILLYAALLFSGLSIYTDYGISWDEVVQRLDNGIVNYNYIHSGDYHNLINGNEKYHGPAFEIALVYLEKILGLESMKDIFLMRHLATFMVFFISILFFYLTAIRQFKSKLLPFFGCLFLILSPRIFADAFYNSKDLVFMSFVIVNIYSTMQLLRKRNLFNAVFHGLVSALVIDTRVMGIIIPAFTYLILLIDFIRLKSERKKIVLVTVINVVFLAVFTILFWPVLWRNPVENFILGISEMSHYHWDSYLLYLGEKANANYTPWHYIPVWIAVSTPLLYLLLFFTGLVYLCKKIISGMGLSVFEWFNLYIIFAPLIAVIALHSVVYDGWRHMFFIYPSILFVVIGGIQWLTDTFQWNKRFIKTLYAGISFYSVYILGTMIYLHPYENVYFNSLAGKNIEEARKNFEIDYWGLSYKEAIEYILRTDSSSSIIIMPQDNPGRDNLRLLEDKDKARFSITSSIELADYYISNYRYHHYPYNIEPTFNVVRNGGNICSVFDLRERKLALETDTFLVSQYFNNMEAENSNWQWVRTVVDSSAFSGSRVESVDTGTTYGGAFSCSPPGVLTQYGNRNYIDVTCMIKSSRPYSTRIILELDSDTEMYGWDGVDIESSVKNKWTKHNFRVALPIVRSMNDVIKVYIWNYQKNNFLIDDIQVKFYSLPESEYKSIMSKMPDAITDFHQPDFN